MPCELCNAFENEKDRVIYSDAHVFVVPILHPIREGHVMIIPIRHAENMKDLNADEARAFMAASNLAMDAVKKEYGVTPMFLVNGWEYRSQPHLHAHVLPSKTNLRGLYAAAEGVVGKIEASAEELKVTADRIRVQF
ncbi:MAG: HIT family protein [Candidatus Uhrbacteria bacterium]